jgi:hypothetical protein
VVNIGRKVLGIFSEFSSFSPNYPQEKADQIWLSTYLSTISTVFFKGGLWIKIGSEVLDVLSWKSSSKGEKAHR